MRGKSGDELISDRTLDVTSDPCKLEWEFLPRITQYNHNPPKLALHKHREKCTLFKRDHNILS